MDEERENALFYILESLESVFFLVSRQGSFIFGGKYSNFFPKVAAVFLGNCSLGYGILGVVYIFRWGPSVI